MPREISAPVDILVVRFSAIGDILLTTPLLRALRTGYPEATISMLTKREYLPLVADNPHLDHVYGMERSEPLRDVARRIRAASHTHLLDLHGSVRTRALRILAPGPWRGYSKRRWARTILIRAKRDLYPDAVPVPERYFEAVGDLGVSPDGGPPEFALGPAALARAERWLAEAGVGGRPFIAIAPGAAHATKQWPLPHWIELVRALRGAGTEMVIVGGPGDAALAQRLVEAVPSIPADDLEGATIPSARLANAVGALSLQETGAVLRRAAVLVSGDTGVMHMATGVGTPVVALFGPTVRAFGFFPYRASAQILERDLPCRPCSAQGGARCPLGHHRCLEEIHPSTVFTAVMRHLKAT